MPKKKEIRVHRTMRVVRSWLPSQGIFKYFTLYSDGQIEPATRREAQQYTAAYDEPVQTIYGEPEDKTWLTTAPVTTGR